MTKSQHTPHAHETVQTVAEAGPLPQALPSVAPPTAGSGEGLAISSMVLGIMSIVSLTGLLLGIPAIILGAIALKKKSVERAFSLTGIITGAISTFLSLLFIIFIVFIFIYAAEHPSKANRITLPDNSYHHYASPDGAI